MKAPQKLMWTKTYLFFHLSASTGPESVSAKALSRTDLTTVNEGIGEIPIIPVEAASWPSSSSADGAGAGCVGIARGCEVVPARALGE